MNAIPPQYPGEVSAISPVEAQQDQTHMKILMILYYVMSGLSVLGVCGGGIYILMGALFQSPEFIESATSGGNEPPPEFMAGLFIAIGIGFVVLSLVLAGLYFLVARGIASRRARVLTMIMAGLSCLSVPIGTALGVYTFIVMLRPGVKRMYGIQP